MSGPPPIRKTNESAEDTRAVFHTLDAIATVAILIAALVAAYQLVGASGGGQVDSVSNQQQQVRAADALEASESTGALKNATLYWDDSAGAWANGDSYYTEFPSGHPLQPAFSAFFSGTGVKYGITIQYLKADEGTENQRLFYQGTPGPAAVVAETTLRLNDTDELVGPSSGTTLENSSSFYAPDAFPDQSQYNLVTVQIVLW
jgi:hypothetical protein